MPLAQPPADYTLPAGQTLSGSDRQGVYVSSGSASVTIDGTLNLNFEGADNVYVSGIVFIGGTHDGSSLTIGSGGSVHVTGPGGAEGVYGSFTPDIINRGLIEILAGNVALGVTTFDTTSRFENSGVIRATADDFARGVWLGNSSAFLNSGLIEATSRAPRLTDGVYLSTTRGVLITHFGADVVNTGTIRAHVSSTPIAVALDMSDGGSGGVLYNSGRLEGDTALLLSARSSGTVQLIANTGDIVGDVKLLGGAFRLENSGSITGQVQFAAGADVYAGQDGLLAGALHAGDGGDHLTGGAAGAALFGEAGADTIVGTAGANYLRGDEGDDRITGGANFDDINGNMGADTASGGEGEDWVVGGKDNDSLSGDAAYDLVYGNLGNDTCDGGGGNDIVRGGQDDDVVLGGAGDDFVSGDKGSDTMTGGLGADLFHTFGDAGVDRVTDFSRAQGDRVQLDPGTQYTVSQSGADTVINMTGGGQMILVGVQMSSLTAGWIFGA